MKIPLKIDFFKKKIFENFSKSFLGKKKSGIPDFFFAKKFLQRDFSKLSFPFLSLIKNDSLIILYTKLNTFFFLPLPFSSDSGNLCVPTVVQQPKYDRYIAIRLFT